MTVSSTTSRWDYTGDGSTVAFAYDNKIFATSEMLVYVAGVLQTETTHYSVSGAGDAGGGTVTFVTAPANDAAVALLRNVANTQPAVLPASGPLPTASVEDSLDRRAIISQQEAEKLNRALVFLASDANLPSGSLPTLSTLKGKVLSFDATTGAPEGTSFGDISVAIDVVETSLADNDFLVYDGANWVNEAPAAARTSMGLGTAAVADTGTANGDVPVLDATGYPAVNGSQITSLDPTNIVQAGAGLLGAAGAGATSERTAAQVLSFLGYSAFKSSSTVCASGSQSIDKAHGLGAVPTRVWATAVCNDAGGDKGWAQNDAITITSDNSVITGATDISTLIGCDATSVFYRRSNSFTYVNKSTLAAATFTASKWDIYLHAVIEPTS